MDQITSYIQSFDKTTQEILINVRKTILSCSDLIEENFSYGMPAYKFKKKPLVYFGAFKSHLGLYATPTGHEAFKEEFAKYKTGKGSVQFPYKEEIPYELIRRVVEFRLNQLQ